MLNYLIVSLNLLAAIAVIIYYRHDHPRAVCYGIIIITIPLFGLLFLAAYPLVKRIFKEQEYVEDKPEKGQQLFSDYRADADEVVPLNDALAIENFTGKRQLLTNAIKEDSLTNQQILKQAVGDDDREVAHYAATILTDRIARLEKQLAMDDEVIRGNNQSDEIKLLIDKVAAMQDYLGLDYLDEKSRQQKVREYSALLAELLALWTRDKQYFAAKINLDIAENDFASAEKYLQLYRQHFSGEEDVYLLAVKLYYKMHDGVRLQQAVEDLKLSPLVLSAEGLRVIRFWSGR